MSTIIERVEEMAANWINGNRKDVIEEITTQSPARAALLTMHLTVELLRAGGDSDGFRDTATLATMLEQAEWRQR